MASKTKKQEKGQARIQQLVEMFPEMTREQLVHADYVNEGLRWTPLLAEVGKWAIPDSHNLYEYGKEHPPQEQTEGGYTLSPYCFYFRNGIQVKTMYDSKGPYEVKYEGRGCFWLYRDDDPIEEVHFSPCPQWFKKTTSSGTPMSSVVDLTADRWLKLVPTNYCEFFRDGNQCRFCNIVPTKEHIAELGQARASKRDQDIYETYLAAVQDTGVDTVGILGGSMYDRKKEADMHIRIFQVLQRAFKDSGHTVPLTYIGQPQEKEDYLRLKEAGASGTNSPMEAWHPKLFPQVSPGKFKSLGGRDHWIECLLGALDVFGPGKVATSFVLGIELTPSFGFKSEEEAAESVIDGWRFWASHGITAGQLPFRTGPGAILEHAPRPRLEYLLKMEIIRHNIMKEHGLFQGRAGANFPPTVTGQNFAPDWTDVPDEALWPPALRYRNQKAPATAGKSRKSKAASASASDAGDACL